MKDGVLRLVMTAFFYLLHIPSLKLFVSTDV
jgi:hypothetical protein